MEEKRPSDLAVIDTVCFDKAFVSPDATQGKEKQSASSILQQFELDTILLAQELNNNEHVQRGPSTMERVRALLQEKGYKIFESNMYSLGFPHTLLLTHHSQIQDYKEDFYRTIASCGVNGLYHSGACYHSA